MVVWKNLRSTAVLLIVLAFVLVGAIAGIGVLIGGEGA